MGSKVLCVGTRLGPAADGMAGIDIDGIQAINKAIELGADPDPGGTWKVGRANNRHRYKLFFRVPKDRWEGLPGKVVIQTETGENIEIFWDSGQCIVAGEHRISGGEYLWLEGTPAHRLAVHTIALRHRCQDLTDTRSAGVHLQAVRHGEAVRNAHGVCGLCA